MNKSNLSVDDNNSSGKLSWINSELYNLHENEIDKNTNCNVITSSTIVVPNQECLKESESNKIIRKPISRLVDPNIQQKWTHLKSKSVAYPSQDNLNTVGTTSNSSAASSTFLNVSMQCANSLPERCFVVSLYIETKGSHMGPLPLEVHPKMNIQLLKLQVEKELGIPTSSQKWIIQNTLVTDSDALLSDYGVTLSSPIFLYVDSNFDKKIDIRQLTGAILSKPSITTIHKCADFNTFLASKQSSAKNMHRSKDKTILTSKIKDNYSFDESLNDSTTLNITNRSNEKEELMLSKRLLKRNNYDSLFGTKFLDIDAKCKSLSENLQVKSLKNPQRNSEKLRNRFLKAKYSNPVQNQTHLSSNEKISYSSSSDISEKSYLEYNYADESASCNIKIHDAVCDSKRFDYPIYNKTNVSNFVTATDHSNGEFGKGSNIEKSECLKSNVDDINFHQSSIIKNCSSNSNKQELCHYGNNISKPKISFLEKLKLKQGAKQVTGIIKEGNGIEDRTFSIGKQSNDSEVPKLVNLNLVNNSLNHKNLCQTSQSEVTDCISDDVSEKEITFYDAVEEIGKKEMLNNKIEHENTCDFEDIAKNSQQSIKNNHDANEPPIAEISIQNVADNTFSETLSTFSKLSTSYPECQNIVPDLENEESAKNYQFLLRMENSSLVRNVINFTCPVCFGEFESDEGVVLHECLHTFCVDCLRKLVEYAEEAIVKCPYRDDFYSCHSNLQQREIKALVPSDVYERYLQRSVTTAESMAEKSFHCKTPDCPGWCMFEDSINVFHCPVCSHYNCLNCMAMHEGLNCRQYQNKLMQQKKRDPDSEKTFQFLNKMIENGKAVKCPKCDLILMKKWGCDWLKCSVCLTEICWITRGPRWGPAGQGDTSGGCRCGVNGIKCHPSCTYCH